MGVWNMLKITAKFVHFGSNRFQSLDVRDNRLNRSAFE